jgi:hypothetical protein
MPSAYIAPARKTDFAQPQARRTHALDVYDDE